MSIFKQKFDMISKLFIYQLAMSLLGLFVVSPFSGKMQVVAAVFSSLFYFSLVCYAVIEDGQKDFISHTAGRMNGKGYTGLVYSLYSYIPTIVVVVVQTALQLFTSSDVLSGLKTILNVIIRFFLMGMYLGFDTGLVQRTQDLNTHQLVTSAPDWLVFMSDKCLIFACLLVLTPIVCGVTYYLAFIGKVHVDTTVKGKKKK